MNDLWARVREEDSGIRWQDLGARDLLLTETQTLFSQMHLDLRSVLGLELRMQGSYKGIAEWKRRWKPLFWSLQGSCRV